MKHARKHISFMLIGIISLTTFALAQQDAGQQDTQSQEQQALASIYDNVLQKNANNAVNSCQALSKTLQQASAGVRSEIIHQDFRNLALSWKKVEATYIAGELDINAMDIPRYLDIFHIGNENIDEQINKVLSNNQNPEVALFKNSYKTINALEVVLYQDNYLSQRELQVANVINQSICNNLNSIKQTYQNQRKHYLEQPERSLSMMLNVLATQSHFLKEWRIADVAGLSKKYENKPNLKRAEFNLSGLSLDAISAILQTQSELIDKQDYPNLVEIAQLYHAQKPLHDNQLLLKKAQTQIADLTSDALANNNESMELYDTTNQLQIGYYQHLIHALPVVSVILEADGD